MFSRGGSGLGKVEQRAGGLFLVLLFQYCSTVSGESMHDSLVEKVKSLCAHSVYPSRCVPGGTRQCPESARMGD